MGFDEWVGARGDALLRFAYLLCGDAYLAEDLVQTVLGRAYQKWARVSGADDVDAYVRRMVVNEHLSWRRRRSSGEVVTDVPDIAVTDATGDLSARDAAWRLLATLPKRQRAVLVLRFFEDLPDEAIAATLGCSAGAVRSYASRGLAALRPLAREEESHGR